MSSFYSRLSVHLVWGTLRRQPWIVPAYRRRLHGLLGRCCRNLDCVPLAVGGVADHVHLLVRLHPSVSVSELVKQVKVSSCHFVHNTLRLSEFYWQEGYGAFSLRDEDRELVRRYVYAQALHHARGTTIDEWERTTPPEEPMG